MTKTIESVVNRLKGLDSECPELERFLERAVLVVESFLSGRSDRPLVYRSMMDYLSKQEDLPAKVRYLVEMTD